MLSGIHSSPILTSSLEIMEHAVEHLKQGVARDWRLAVLHADNAIELLLKELARVNGIRLIDKKGHSISYYECVDKLQAIGVKVPGLPDIDILHTERNSIYHLGNQPDKKKAEWLVYDVALTLMRRVCMDNFNYDIDTFSEEFILPHDVRCEIELTKSEMINRYLGDSLDASKSEMFNASVVFSYTAIEVFLREGIPLDLRQRIREMDKLIADDLISKEDVNDFIVIRNIRNRVLHGGQSATKEETEFAIETSKRIVASIDSVLM